MQFQYFLPAYSSSYPLTHTYTPISSTVSTIRQYPGEPDHLLLFTRKTNHVNNMRLSFLPSFVNPLPVTPQAPSSALPTQAGVGVATTVHLNHMQLMAVDRIGLPSAQISTQGIQPAPITAQGIQPAAIGVQSLHTTAPAQGIQPAPIVTQQQGQAEAKPGKSETK